MSWHIQRTRLGRLAAEHPTCCALAGMALLVLAMFGDRLFAAGTRVLGNSQTDLLSTSTHGQQQP